MWNFTTKKSQSVTNSTKLPPLTLLPVRTFFWILVLVSVAVCCSPFCLQHHPFFHRFVLILLFPYSLPSYYLELAFCNHSYSLTFVVATNRLSPPPHLDLILTSLRFSHSLSFFTPLLRQHCIYVTALPPHNLIQTASLAIYDLHHLSKNISLFSELSSYLALHSLLDIYAVQSLLSQINPLQPTFCDSHSTCRHPTFLCSALKLPIRTATVDLSLPLEEAQSPSIAQTLQNLAHSIYPLAQEQHLQHLRSDQIKKQPSAKPFN